MRKHHSVLHEIPTGGRRSRLPLLFGLVVLVIASPFLYEWGLLIHAQWRSMTGAYTVAQTPLLDAAWEWSRGAEVSTRSGAARVFDSGPWSPSLAVPLAVGWAVAMAFMFLRRVR
jgi:hypothetical protein